jgi:hypothetical protein
MGVTSTAGPCKDADVPKVRPYLFYDTAVSLCTECLRRVEAKLVIQENRVLRCTNGVRRTARARC